MTQWALRAFPLCASLPPFNLVKRIYLIVLMVALGGCATTSTDPRLKLVRNTFKKPSHVWDGNKDARLPSPPRLTKDQNPIYPKELKGSGVSGYGLVRYVIEQDGSTGFVVCTEATNRYFAVEVVNAVRGWEYVPSELDGLPVAVLARTRFAFFSDGRVRKTTNENTR